jgi:hypothetical protein
MLETPGVYSRAGELVGWQEGVLIKDERKVGK